MKKWWKNLILNVFGIFILLLGIIAVINTLWTQGSVQVLWMCYICLLLIGIGILIRSSFLIMSQLYIITIPLLLWDVDFLYRLIMQKSLIGVTDYFFIGSLSEIGKIITLQHLFIIPLAIYLVYLIGVKRRDAWKLSFIQIILVFFLGILFTSPEANINCVFEPCINIFLGLPYQLTWFLIAFLLIIVSNLIINQLPFLRSWKT